ncbi:MAG: RNA methyltransferase [Bacteroidetes bacterium]|jgi:23S rRNA (guanosine2251-2'-O)-methyltransferase|nr:RNA methyltransferase [Bacteroidota bacterium]MDA0879696.1 RNA methyltransferase [Bacteroidota bacterium]MDA1115329.1 RNA methyltransferase [Bacteroidota bacterium]
MKKTANQDLIRLEPEAFKTAKKTKLRIVLDDLRSLNNIGSIFRTSDAFLVEKIYLCGITAQPPHRDIQKTALGSTETVDWEYHAHTLSLIKTLQEEGVIVLGIEQAEGAIWLQEFQPNPQLTYAIVFGNEVKGVAQEVIDQCDGVIEIPQFGSKHSLNVAVSAGVVIWELFNKLKS